MMEQPLGRAPARQGHPERVEREIVRDALVHRPADGEARTEIEDHRQVEPTLARRNVGDVGDPRLVRPSTLELGVDASMSPAAMRWADVYVSGLGRALSPGAPSVTTSSGSASPSMRWADVSPASMSPAAMRRCPRRRCESPAADGPTSRPGLPRQAPW